MKPNRHSKSVAAAGFPTDLTPALTLAGQSSESMCAYGTQRKCICKCVWHEKTTIRLKAQHSQYTHNDFQSVNAPHALTDSHTKPMEKCESVRCTAENKSVETDLAANSSTTHFHWVEHVEAMNRFYTRRISHTINSNNRHIENVSFSCFFSSLFSLSLPHPCQVHFHTLFVLYCIALATEYIYSML